MPQKEALNHKKQETLKFTFKIMTPSHHQVTQPGGRHSILDSDVDVEYEASSPTKRDGIAETRVEKAKYFQN